MVCDGKAKTNLFPILIYHIEEPETLDKIDKRGFWGALS